MKKKHYSHSTIHHHTLLEPASIIFTQQVHITLSAVSICAVVYFQPLCVILYICFNPLILWYCGLCDWKDMQSIKSQSQRFSRRPGRCGSNCGKEDCRVVKPKLNAYVCYFRSSILYGTCCLSGKQYTIGFLRFCKQVCIDTHFTWWFYCCLFSFIVSKNY